VCPPTVDLPTDSEPCGDCADLDEALRIEELADMLSPDDGQLSTMNGMLANGSHPRAIANKILADRT
jgi:hypothetical protein